MGSTGKDWLELNEREVVGFVWAREGMKGTEVAVARVSDGRAASGSQGFPQPDGNRVRLCTASWLSRWSVELLYGEGVFNAENREGKR